MSEPRAPGLRLRALAASWLLGLLAAAIPRTAAALSAEDLLRMADRPREAFSQAVIRVKATVLENGRAGRPVEFDIYRKGEDRSLMIFRSGSQSGRKVLTAGEKVWLIVPGSAHAIPVTPNQRLMGGASMGDVARLRFSEEFEAAFSGATESVGGIECDVLNLKARRKGASYGSGKLWIDRHEHLARRAVLNLVSGKPAKEVTFERYRTEGADRVLAAMRIRDLLTTRSTLETILEYSRYRTARLPDSLFTPDGALDF